MKRIKTSKKLVLAFAATVATGGFATTQIQAQTVIYSDTLTGNGTQSGHYTIVDPLNGSTPDTTDTGGATWIAQGNVGDSHGWVRGPQGAGAFYVSPAAGDNAYLPFTPVVGTSYVLQATIMSPNGGNTEIGFVGSAPLSTPQAGSGSLGPATELATIQVNYNNPYVAFSTDGTYGASEQPYAPGTVGSDKVSVQITLTAAGSGWTATAVGTDEVTSATLFSFAPVTLADGSNIGFVGFDSNVNNDIVSNFSLTELSAVPEPGTWALMGLGMLALGVLQRRRMANGASV